MPADLPPPAAFDVDTLLGAAERSAIELPLRNTAPQGVLAATPNAASEARRYTRTFGRDAAICMLAMAGLGVPRSDESAIDALEVPINSRIGGAIGRITCRCGAKLQLDHAGPPMHWVWRRYRRCFALTRSRALSRADGLQRHAGRARRMGAEFIGPGIDT